jgi:hypothetical protein
MTAEHELERLLAAELPRELERMDGPHPAWATSPAARRVARRRAGVRWPGRLLAIAAVLAVAGGVALLIGLRRDAVGGCPTLADYAAASAAPTLPPLGTAPGVSFPPVAPDASPTTGRLKPGDWAIISDDEGPGIQMRVRDVRECGRLPDYRSTHPGGSLILVTADIRSLRTGALPAWIGPVDYLGMGLAGVGYGKGTFEHFFEVPGFDIRTDLDPPPDFAFSGLVLFDVPRTDAMVTADHPFPLGMSVGREEVQQATPTVSWVLRAGRETGGDAYWEAPRRSPGTSPSVGEQPLGTYATIADANGNVDLTITDVDQVAGYPGRVPKAGYVFLEARLHVPATVTLTPADADVAWHAVDGDGRELAFLERTDPNVGDAGVLAMTAPRIPAGEYWWNWGGWLVVEAPETGLVRLELWRDGESTPLVSYVIRQP